MKVTANRGTEIESAANSNAAALKEKLEANNKLVSEKEAEVAGIRDRIGQLEMENAQLREEIGVYKGRCTNLARDVEMHYNEMHRLNADSGSAGQQVRILQERTQSLEMDVETMRCQRNEA